MDAITSSLESASLQDTSQLLAELQALRLENASLKLRLRQFQAKQRLSSGSSRLLSPSTPRTVSRRSPANGSPVICYHTPSKAYYKAIIEAFDPEACVYRVRWEDNDPSGRDVAVPDCALNEPADAEDIGVGSSVIFREQGSYSKGKGETRRTVVDDDMYWRGEVVNAYVDAASSTLRYDVRHNRSEKHMGRVLRGLALYDLRHSPNVLDLLGSGGQSGDSEQTDAGASRGAVDVLISFSEANSSSRSAAKGLPPSAAAEAFFDPAERLRDEISGWGFSCALLTAEDEAGVALEQIQNCRVFVAAISNEYVADGDCTRHFTFCKRSARKPVIPLVLGTGGFEWMRTVVGLLIAGDLFIHFSSADLLGAKLAELKGALTREVNPKPPATSASPASAAPRGVASPDTLASSGTASASRPDDEVSDVFISYCWLNSDAAKKAGQIQAGSACGNKLADPRSIAAALRDAGLRVWLDVWRLEGGRGLFEDIAKGLLRTRVVLACVSDEYSQSENCRMELQYACKSLKLRIVPVVVGQGDGWPRSVVGLLVASVRAASESAGGFAGPPIDLRAVSAVEWPTVLPTVIERVQHALVGANSIVPSSTLHGARPRREALSNTPSPSPAGGTRDTTPLDAATDRGGRGRDLVGEHVLAYHTPSRAYFWATIASFNAAERSFDVIWDDGDTTGRTVDWHDIARDFAPATDEVGVGSEVLFAHGTYVLNNASHKKWHRGCVTRFEGTVDIKYWGAAVVKGTKPGGGTRTFDGVAINDLRSPPNIFNLLGAGTVSGSAAIEAS